MFASSLLISLYGTVAPILFAMQSHFASSLLPTSPSQAVMKLGGTPLPSEEVAVVVVEAVVDVVVVVVGVVEVVVVVGVVEVVVVVGGVEVVVGVGVLGAAELPSLWSSRFCSDHHIPRHPALPREPQSRRSKLKNAETS